MPITVNRRSLAEAIATLRPLIKSLYPHRFAQLPVDEWKSSPLFDPRHVCFSLLAGDDELYATVGGEDWKASVTLPAIGNASLLAPASLLIKTLNKASSDQVELTEVEGGVQLDGIFIPCPDLSPLEPVLGEAEHSVPTRPLRRVGNLEEKSACWIFPTRYGLYLKGDGLDKFALQSRLLRPSTRRAVLVNAGDLLKIADRFSDLLPKEARLGMTVQEDRLLLKAGSLSAELNGVPTDEAPPEFKKPQKKVAELLKEESYGDYVARVEKTGGNYRLLFFLSNKKVQVFVPGMSGTICRSYKRLETVMARLEQWKEYQRSLQAGDRRAELV